MLVLRLLLMLVVTGEQYSTSPVHLRKLFKDELNEGEDNVMWNDAYFDRMLEVENSAELLAPVNADIDDEDADLDEEDEYNNEEEEGADAENEEEEEEVNDDVDDDDNEDEDTGVAAEYGLARYDREILDDENPYEERGHRGKFARRAGEDPCNDGATEALHYFEYDPGNQYDMASGESRNFRGVASLTEVIATACLLFLID